MVGDDQLAAEGGGFFDDRRRDIQRGQDRCDRAARIDKQADVVPTLGQLRRGQAAQFGRTSVTGTDMLKPSFFQLLQQRVDRFGFGAGRQAAAVLFHLGRLLGQVPGKAGLACGQAGQAGPGVRCGGLAFVARIDDGIPAPGGAAEGLGLQGEAAPPQPQAQQAVLVAGTKTRL